MAAAVKDYVGSGSWAASYLQCVCRDAIVPGLLWLCCRTWASDVIDSLHRHIFSACESQVTTSRSAPVRDDVIPGLFFTQPWHHYRT